MTGDQLNANGYGLHSVDLTKGFSGNMNGGCLIVRKPRYCDFSTR